jgi:hypothetical protein
LKKKVIKRLIVVVMVSGLLLAGTAFGSEMNSTNFKMEYSSFDAGGEDQTSSSGYGLSGAVGEIGSLQLENLSYRLEGGLSGGTRNNTPDKPTLTNPSEYYERLHLVIDDGENPEDVIFAIAISNDNWVTTNYVQDDYFIGSALGIEDWATYAGWGGAAGFEVLGLDSSTSYKVKVMAFETEFGPESDPVSTVDPYIIFTFSGVGSGVFLEGQVTDVATGAHEVDFGDFDYGTRLIAASNFGIATNALEGYTLTVRQDGNLEDVNGSDIDQFPNGEIGICNNASPCVWSSPSEGISENTWGHFGYHTSDDDLGMGVSDRFLDDNTYCAFEETVREVGFHDGQVLSGDEIYMVYSLEVSRMQSSSSYAGTLTYIASGKY